MKPFAFSEETKKEPTQFEVFFRTNVAEYRYILHVRQDIVAYESLDRIKLDTGRRSALFVRNGGEVDLKGVFGKIKISEEISENLPLLSYLGITYKKNEIISDVIRWFEDSIDFLNYGNPRQELRTAIAKTDDVKKLVMDEIKLLGQKLTQYKRPSNVIIRREPLERTTTRKVKRNEVKKLLAFAK